MYPPWPTNDEKPVFGRKQPPETRNLARSSQPSPSQPSPLLQNVPQIRKSQKAQNPAETPKSSGRKTFFGSRRHPYKPKMALVRKYPVKVSRSSPNPYSQLPRDMSKIRHVENPKSSIRVEKFCFSKNESFIHPCIASQISHSSGRQVDSLLPPEKNRFSKNPLLCENSFSSEKL